MGQALFEVHEIGVPPDPLVSATNKLLWAHFLGRQIQQVYDAYFEAEPYRIQYHPDESARRANFTVEVLTPPPLEMAMMAGDLVHNARSSLDHLVFELARVNSPSASLRKLHGVTFPLTSDPARWPQVSSRMRLCSVDVQDRIRQLQPFEADTSRDDVDARFVRLMLGRLNELDRRDKHRMLTPTLMASGAMLQPQLSPPYLVTSYGVVAGPLQGADQKFAHWNFEGRVPRALPEDVQLSSLIPLHLAFPDEPRMRGGDSKGVVVLDMMTTLARCVQAAKRALLLFYPCFEGQAPLKL